MSTDPFEQLSAESGRSPNVARPAVESLDQGESLSRRITVLNRPTNVPGAPSPPCTQAWSPPSAEVRCSRRSLSSPSNDGDRLWERSSDDRHIADTAHARYAPIAAVRLHPATECARGLSPRSAIRSEPA